MWALNAWFVDELPGYPPNSRVPEGEYKKIVSRNNEWLSPDVDSTQILKAISVTAWLSEWQTENTSNVNIFNM